MAGWFLAIFWGLVNFRRISWDITSPQKFPKMRNMYQENGKGSQQQPEAARSQKNAQKMPVPTWQQWRNMRNAKTFGQFWLFLANLTILDHFWNLCLLLGTFAIRLGKKTTKNGQRWHKSGQNGTKIGQRWLKCRHKQSKAAKAARCSKKQPKLTRSGLKWPKVAYSGQKKTKK